MQKEVEEVKVDSDLIQFVVKIVQETRKDNHIYLGASPRATLALLRAAQAEAYLRGRNYCIPDDIIKMVLPVISHRIILSPETKSTHQSPEKIMKGILAKIPVPVLS